MADLNQLPYNYPEEFDDASEKSIIKQQVVLLYKKYRTKVQLWWAVIF